MEENQSVVKLGSVFAPSSGGRLYMIDNKKFEMDVQQKIISDLLVIYIGWFH